MEWHIWQVYTRYMPGTYTVFTKSKVKTWRLVLLSRIGPHSTTSSCNNISRPSDYSDFIAPPPGSSNILRFCNWTCGCAGMPVLGALSAGHCRLMVYCQNNLYNMWYLPCIIVQDLLSACIIMLFDAQLWTYPLSVNMLFFTEQLTESHSAKFVITNINTSYSLLLASYLSLAQLSKLNKTKHFWVNTHLVKVNRYQL